MTHPDSDTDRVLRAAMRRLDDLVAGEDDARRAVERLEAHPRLIDPEVTAEARNGLLLRALASSLAYLIREHIVDDDRPDYARMAVAAVVTTLAREDRTP